LGELVAEISSCYACRELGVPASDDLSNHIAYVKSWLQAMRNDPRFIFMASAQASKATDFILSFSRKPEDVPVPDDELVTA
jgi:antirestriction protein ArdC